MRVGKFPRYFHTHTIASQSLQHTHEAGVLFAWGKRRLRELHPLAQSHTAGNCGSNLDHMVLSPVFLHAPDFIDPKVLCP